MISQFFNTLINFVKNSILISLLCTIVILAGDTGKIQGVVKELKTGEPLIGVNIYLKGTKIGVTTDIDGKYTMIGVPPGNYSLVFSYIGYQKVTMTNVEVLIDRTTNASINMSEESIDLGSEVVVTATRPPIALDVSSSKRDIEIADVVEMPLLDFNSLLNMQPGTIFQTRTSDAQEQITQELSIRGGTGIGVFVDGLNITEALSSGSLTNFNLSSLKAAEILTGGFNAEYGNIRSGVINVVTKDGTKDYQLHVDAKVSPAGRKHFGESIYDQNTAPEWVLYGHDDALYGPDGTHDAANPDSYWEYFAANDTVYGFTPEQAQEVWKYQHRERKYGNKPDYIIDASLGGPIPLLNNYKFGEMVTFFTSLRYEYNMFSVPLSRDHYEDMNWFWKLTLNPGSALKINIQGSYQMNLSSTTYNTPQVSVATAQQAIFSMQYPLTKYYQGMRSIADRYRNQFAINLTHAPSEKTFYDLKLSYLLRRSYVNHADYRSSKSTFTVGGYTFDVTPEGYADNISVSDFGGRENDFGLTTDGYSFIFSGHGKERDYSREVLINTRFDIVSQLDKYHQIKAGAEFNYNDLDMNHGLIDLSDALVKMDKFRRIPIKAALYAQDKIEFIGMIANIGLRLDYTDRKGTYFTDLFSNYFEADSLQYAATAEVKPFLYLSPRVGISHPISDKSKMFFNYGHFYDEPAVTYLYNKRERYGGYYDRIENSNLKPQRTIAYELGFEQQIGDQYLLHISGYYRNITNQIMWVSYYSSAGNLISSYSNDNYADSRGLEAIFEKKLGDFFTGNVSLDYMITSSGNYGNSTYYEDELKTPVISSSTQSTPGASYTFLINLTFKTPPNWGSELLNADVFGDWILNITHEYRSGHTFTYNPKSLPGISNNMRWRAHQTTNLRVSKAFDVSGINMQAYMEVYNLFNRKELTPQLRSLMLPSIKLYNEYLASLVTEDEGGSDQPGDYEADHIKLPASSDFPTQLLFNTPRDIYFGIRLNF